MADDPQRPAALVYGVPTNAALDQFERLPETLAWLHYLAFAMLMLKNFVQVMAHVL